MVPGAGNPSAAEDVGQSPHRANLQMIEVSKKPLPLELLAWFQAG